MWRCAAMAIALSIVFPAPADAQQQRGIYTPPDLSTVRGGAASLRPGAAIALYGTPTEQKFQAMGIVPPDNRPAPRPATIPSRR